MSEHTRETVTGVVGVVGAGAMGTGIAQVAAVAGQRVLLFDSVAGAAERAVAKIAEQVDSLVAKGKIKLTHDGLDLIAAASLAELAPAAVVVEAIVEDLAVKRALFAELETLVVSDCMLATNTSSLSPTAIAAGAKHPERFVGLHFFNPVGLMRLVEVVPGLATSPAVVDAADRLATAWGKTVVRSAPTPGFIVNRVARPFYGEAWRIYEERAAEPITIDAVLEGGGGFRMGPFALIDMIGHDVNEIVTRTVWEAFAYDPRFSPSLAQRDLVAGGRLGRKSGRGVYDYTPGSVLPVAVSAETREAPVEVTELGTSELHPLLARSGVTVISKEGDDGLVEMPSGALMVRCSGISATELSARYGTPVVVVDRTLDDSVATAIAIAVSDRCPDKSRDEAVGLLQAGGLEVHHIDDIPGLVVSRTVATLVNAAFDALHREVANAADIDTAMRLGTNYPLGPLEWGERWGLDSVHTILSGLQAVYGERYRPTPLLRRAVLSGAARREPR